MSICAIERAFNAETPISGQLDDTEDILKARSVKIRCVTCLSENFTRVERKGMETGTAWAILCGCFGSCYGIYLVLCSDGFTEFFHYCPSCHALIGTYKPTFSRRLKLLLIIAILGIVALKIIAFIFIVMPKLNGMPRVEKVESMFK